MSHPSDVLDKLGIAVMVLKLTVATGGWPARRAVLRAPGRESRDTEHLRLVGEELVVARPEFRVPATRSATDEWTCHDDQPS